MVAVVKALARATVATPEEGLKLHIGCGHTRMAGWVNCDLYRTPAADRVFDCQARWPFPDDSVAAVYASHVLEHLARPMDFLREMWRCLRANGVATLRLPYGGHKSAWWDPTHLRPWYAESFACLQPNYAALNGNPQHEAWVTPYGIGVIDLKFGRDWLPWLRWRWQRRVLGPWLDVIPGLIEELWAHLYALKTPEAVQAYRQGREPHVVPVRYVAWDHEVRRRALAAGEPPQMRPLYEAMAWSTYGENQAR